MKKPLNRVLLITVMVVLLPLIAFTVYQISTLNENERVITEIYDSQLEAILFSVNQYSQDLIDAWARDINLALADTLNDEDRLLQLLEDNESLTLIFLSDSSLNEYESYSMQQGSNSAIEKILLDSLKAQSAELEKLFTFQQGGYIRKAPLGNLTLDSIPNQSGLIFLLDPGTTFRVCLLVLDPNLFITQTLAQKIQSVTQEKFIISAFDQINNSQIIIRDSIAGATPQKRPLWLLPNYSLGIVLKGATIETLAKKRTTNNLIILIAVDLMLLIGVWLIYRNTRKEIQLAQIKSDFVSNVSHEIRTPLSMISMFAETLAMERVVSEEKKREYYRIIGQEADRLTAIVNKILSFSRIESGKIKYNKEPVDLLKIVGNILKTYDYHLKSKGFTCNFQPNGNLGPILADPHAVTEAVINLLDNAIKYSKDIREIGVSLGADEESVFVEVSDQGVGISPQDQKYIFDKFYRVPTGAVHNTKGTGLGLTLVTQIMEAHGGTVLVDSEPGRGSRFRLKFPRTHHNNEET